MNQTKYLHLLGQLEGLSLLFLLFVAMPLKHLFGIEHFVKYVGTIHGILFLMYAHTLISYIYEIKLPKKNILIGLVAASLPFGSFWFNKKYLT